MVADAVSNEKGVDKDVIFASMLLDFSNNHEYFFHKYNVSNEMKNNINLYSKLLKEIKSIIMKKFQK